MSARRNLPSATVFGDSGDSGNGRLRNINPNGIVSAVAGSDGMRAGRFASQRASFNGAVDVVSDPAGQLCLGGRHFTSDVMNRSDTYTAQLEREHEICAAQINDIGN